MKRIVALLIVLLLVSSVATLAEVYDKPILFRGIEWGASCADIAKEIPLEESMYGDGGSIIGVMRYPQDKKFDNGVSFHVNSAGDAPEVAGYRTSGFSLYFASVPDDNGHLPVAENGDWGADPERSRLYHAFYGIMTDDQEAAFEDLTQKLTSLYGDVDIDDRVRVWYGSNGTHVALEKVSAFDGSKIRVHYGCEDGIGWLREAQDVIDNAFATNTEGL